MEIYVHSKYLTRFAPGKTLKFVLFSSFRRIFFSQRRAFSDKSKWVAILSRPDHQSSSSTTPRLASSWDEMALLGVSTLKFVAFDSKKGSKCLFRQFFCVNRRNEVELKYNRRKLHLLVLNRLLLTVFAGIFPPPNPFSPFTKLREITEMDLRPYFERYSIPLYLVSFTNDFL